jgi:hypothetical protein
MPRAGLARLVAFCMGVSRAMPGPTRSLLDEGTRVLQELAVQQGLAYRTYGEALQRFGEDQIEWKELFKTSSDIYFKEVAQVVWSLIRANTNVYAWMLSAAGAKPIRQEADPPRDEPPAGRRAQRGRG